MNASGQSKSRLILSCFLALFMVIQVLYIPALSVSAASFQYADSPTSDSAVMPEAEVTPTPQQPPETSFNPGDVSITLIFETIIKWLFGKDLTQIFNEIELTAEQKEQIALLTGETNPVELVNNFCTQVHSGDFARMADSVRESNQSNGSGALSPAILMDFFEQLGAFCPADSTLTVPIAE